MSMITCHSHSDGTAICRRSMQATLCSARLSYVLLCFCRIRLHSETTPMMCELTVSAIHHIVRKQLPKLEPLFPFSSEGKSPARSVCVQIEQQLCCIG